jgi:hypothetical protein
MTDQARLRRDALRVYQGDTNIQHQELAEQLDDLLTLAIMFGLYDAADAVRDLNHPLGGTDD